MIVFQNEGEIDLQAITTLGVNAKDEANGSAIGFFGTGLKYALAVLLREGQRPSIWIGLEQYKFGLESFEIRGKKFQRLLMWHSGQAQPLSFTTEFGKNWTLENAYRELWSNCKDENGQILQLAQGEALPCAKGQTLVCVEGPGLEEVHRNRWEFLLDKNRKKLVSQGAGLEIYAGGSNYAFYKGIAVLKLPLRSTYTYNITSTVPLTEDRTLSGGSYHLDCLIRSWASVTEDEEILEDVLIPAKDSFEERISYYSGYQVSKEFEAVIRKGLKANPERVNQSAAQLYFSHTKGSRKREDWEKAKLTSGEEGELEWGLATVQDWGFDYTAEGYEVVVTEFCGPNTLARAEGNSLVVLKREILSQRTLLLRALLEEFVHHKFQVADNSREMQNALFGQIIRLGQQISDINAEVAAQVNVSERSLGSAYCAYDDTDAIPF